MDVVDQALKIVQEANTTLNVVTSMVEELMEKNFSAQADSSVTEAQDALNITLQLTSNIHGQNCVSVMLSVTALWWLIVVWVCGGIYRLSHLVLSK